MATLYRAQLLLGEAQHEALARIAEEQGRSLSDLVREIVRQYLADREDQAKSLAAQRSMERLSQIRSRLREEKGVYPGDPLAEVRDEWDQEVERVLGGRP
jgi:predicted DNA-binding protein